MAIELTDASLEEAIASGVALVDFWAPWCGPCQMQGPIIDKLAKEYDGRAKVCKINVDDNSDSAAKFGVMSIPSLIIFKDGKKVQQFVGVQSEEKLKSALDALM